MAQHEFDLVVIGSGPGGYVAAIRAAQLGMNVAVIERAEVGGVCLNWGCIPTKALLRSAEVFHLLQRHKEFGMLAENVSIDFPAIIGRSRKVAMRLSKGVEFLFKKNNIIVITGNAEFVSAHELTVKDDTGNVVETVNAKRVLIATGARPRELPGVAFNGKTIITSKEAMSLETLPQTMIIIGAGAIGVEFAYFYQSLGCQVHLVEMMPSILPIEDQEITKILTTQFKKMKIKIYTDSRVQSVESSADSVAVTVLQNDKEFTLEANVALVAIGVQGNSENLGLDRIGVNVEKSWIPVNANYQTSVESIFAIGDIIGPPWLAHVASSEGIVAVEKLAGLNPPAIDYKSIPGCTYCQPQVASIGLTEAKAIENGFDITVGRFPFQANGKSLALGESQGLVKLIFEKSSHQLLGAHIIHAEATEMINELSVVKNNNVDGHQLLKTIHAHPTLSEAIMEAAAAAYDEAIHI
ncbi:dihydrolipoyl dehydrogenase [candidate division KSB1 bacterium]|nr:dihydrolipoyl dehydrogenase [candidate division KSB1 bacterium]